MATDSLFATGRTVVAKLFLQLLVGGSECREGYCRVRMPSVSYVKITVEKQYEDLYQIIRT